MGPSFGTALRKVKERYASKKLFSNNDPTVIAALEAAQNAKHVMRVIYAAHSVNGGTENRVALVKAKRFRTQFTRRQWGKLFHASDQNSELKRFAKKHVNKKTNLLKK